MNSCSVCLYVDAKVSGAPFMYGGASYCKRHLILAMSPAKEKSKLKWESDKVQE